MFDIHDLLPYIRDYGYIIIFFYSLGGGVLALAAGVFLASIQELDLAIVISIVAVSNGIGDLLLFYMGKYHKKELQNYSFWIKHRRKVAYSKILIKKYGVLAIFIQKFIYGVKTVVPIIFGITNYNFKKFAFFNVFASILWSSSVGLIIFYSIDYFIRD
jgi:membrane protein DedA with SNARE-associated domain